jgi:hypothetical protein
MNTCPSGGTRNSDSVIESAPVPNTLDTLSVYTLETRTQPLSWDQFDELVSGVTYIVNRGQIWELGFLCNFVGCPCARRGAGDIPSASGTEDPGSNSANNLALSELLLNKIIIHSKVLNLNFWDIFPQNLGYDFLQICEKWILPKFFKFFQS